MNKPAISGNLAAIPTPAVSAQGTSTVMGTAAVHNSSHAALVAEVTALRASLGDAVELCEDLRADRDALRAALDIMVRAFNVESIDPLVAFASIERARAALGRAGL